MSKRTRLTIAGAKEYVAGYYEGDAGVKAHVIEGAGIFTPEGQGAPVCRLNVIVTYDDGRREPIQWDVFEEDDGEGGTDLRGEF